MSDNNPTLLKIKKRQTSKPYLAAFDSWPPYLADLDVPKLTKLEVR